MEFVGGLIVGFLVAQFVRIRIRGDWREEAPSDKQIEFARKLGIEIPRGATKGEVSDLISKVTGK